MELIKSEFHTGILSESEDIFVKKLKDDEQRRVVTSAIIAAYDSNGREKLETPGSASSYIKKSEYYQRVKIVGIPDEFAKTLELALNWNACGKGKGGMAAAAVRWVLRYQLDETRETTVVSVLDDSHYVLLSEYLEAYKSYPHVHAIWSANAWNVLGIATSCFIREMHHWDAQNTRPQKAMIGALSQESDISDSEIRKLFYISIHPVPLKVMTKVLEKAQLKDDVDICEVVKMRLQVAPAGLAAVTICGSVAESIYSEFGKKAMKDEHAESLDALQATAARIKSDPLGYHPFAAHFGIDRKVVNMVPLKLAMSMTAGFIKSQVRGTLSQSPALNKWIGTEQRMVNRFSDAFTKYYEDNAEDLIYLISGTVSEERKNEIVNSSLRTLTSIAKISKEHEVDLGDLKEKVIDRLTKHL